MYKSQKRKNELLNEYLRLLLQFTLLVHDVSVVRTGGPRTKRIKIEESADNLLGSALDQGMVHFTHMTSNKKIRSYIT
jgi:hypothetical protein